MVDWASVEQVSRIFTDENGNEFVGIPREIWDSVRAERELEDKRKAFEALLNQPVDYGKPDWLTQLQAREEQLRSIDVPQQEKIELLLKAWEERSDDASDEWWNEFRAFLKENRIKFPERNLNWDDNE